MLSYRRNAITNRQKLISITKGDAVIFALLMQSYVRRSGAPVRGDSEVNVNQPLWQ